MIKKGIVLDISASFRPLSEKALMSFIKSEMSFFERIIFDLYGALGITSSSFSFNNEFYLLQCDLKVVLENGYVTPLDVKNGIDYAPYGTGTNLEAGVDTLVKLGFPRNKVTVITDGCDRPVEGVTTYVYPVGSGQDWTEEDILL